MKTKRYWRYALVVILAAVVAIFLADRPLPSLEGRTVSHALTRAESADTRLAQAFAAQAQAHPGESGIYSLADAHDAFAARVLLARTADKTIDIQCYIWHDDVTGSLLLEELRAAADRGVRVRLLLDDNGTSGLDEKLAALDAHPEIEVRLFNPFVIRKPKVIGFLTDFDRANRRMHNKSFTADNQATIIGGRNVGDEYFGAASVLFADLDVLAIGAVVDDVSKDFDLYWASESSYPADRILPAAEPSALQDLAKIGELMTGSEVAGQYTEAVKAADFMTGLLEGKLEFEWAKTTMVSDDPAKGVGKATRDALLLSQLAEILGKPAHSVDLVSPYFVPTASGVDFFAGLVDSGIQVRILTNSLAATDVAAVHAGYAKRREDILRAGVTLYEMRAVGESDGQSENADSTDASGSGPSAGSGSAGGGVSGSGSGSGGSGSGSGGSGGGSAPFGSSGSSLHAKTFAVDSKRIFVGSFNFDPRSARFNTELGFVIESPNMAREIETSFEEDIPLSSYTMQLTESGDLVWIERVDGREIRHDSEPDTDPLTRGFVWFLSLLPIEWML